MVSFFLGAAAAGFGDSFLGTDTGLGVSLAGAGVGALGAALGDAGLSLFALTLDSGTFVKT